MWQNVYSEVFLQSSNFRRKLQAVLEYTFRERKKILPRSPLLSKDKGLKDIGHIMSIRNLILCVNSVTVSYLVHYDCTLLQNATDLITKCDSYFITKCGRSLLQNAPGFLLKNATVLLQNCDNYYKIR